MSGNLGERVAVSWRRLIGESALIVLSILLAFAIDAWWSGRGMATLGRQWLAELESEFESNLQRLEARNNQIQIALDRFELFIRSTPSILARLPRDSVRPWLCDFVAHEHMTQRAGPRALLVILPD